MPIIQDIQNQLNKLNESLSGSLPGEDRNIVHNVSDSDNVTSDESLLLTSSDDLDNSGHHQQVSNSVAGRGAPVSNLPERRVVETRPGGSGVQGGQYVARGQADELRHAELQKTRAEVRAQEIVKQAANAKANLLKPPGESSLNYNIDPSDSLVVHHDHGKPNPISEPGTSGISQLDSVQDCFRRAFMIDQKHAVLGAHIDDCVREAIQRGDYVNLS